MKKSAWSVLLLSLATTCLLPLASAQAPAAPAPAAAKEKAPAPPAVDASAPLVKLDAKTGQPDAGFMKMHESFLKRAKAGPIGVLFLGDSITQGWSNPGRAHIWERYFGAYQPANFGIGGDRTYHVIWRIENGELDGVQAKVVVLMIGTNNSHEHTGAQLAAANQKIIGLIHAKMPEAKVLLLAIFPRGPNKNKDGVITAAAIADATKRMAAITEANALLAKLDNGKNIRFLDIGDGFRGQDGNIPFSIMPDQLHLTNAGYQLWADAMKKTLDEMMK